MFECIATGEPVVCLLSVWNSVLFFPKFHSRVLLAYQFYLLDVIELLELRTVVEAVALIICSHVFQAYRNLNSLTKYWICCSCA